MMAPQQHCGRDCAFLLACVESQTLRNYSHGVPCHHTATIISLKRRSSRESSLSSKISPKSILPRKMRSGYSKS
ncbi:hypothetical protein E2542_SST21070 [Spatholobus suberectus]|nr:hypothetical protein E2542_SST21070 [Spatholobus suberectus]